MEDPSSSTSRHGTRKRNRPERWPRPLYSQDSAQEEQTMSQTCQAGDMVVIKVEVEDEEYVGDSKPCAERNPDERYTRYRMQKSPIGSSDDDNEAHDTTADSPEATDAHPGLDGASDFFIRVSHGGGRTFTLTKGREFFTPTSGLLSHQKSHTEKHPASPGSIAKRLAHYQGRRSRHPKSPFSCLKCNRRFKYRSYLLVHQQVHTREKRYSHECCRSSLGQDSVEEKSMSCLECGKYCRRRWDLLRHLRCHTGEKPFSCGRSFSHKGVLIDHQKSHTGEKARGKRSAYSVHNRLDTGEWPYVCSDCGQGFTNKAHLVKHQKSHKGEREVFSCPKCGKCCKTQSLLTRHQKVHSREEPSSCLECGKSFTGKSDLLTHQAECGSQTHVFGPSGKRTSSRAERHKRRLEVASHQIPKRREGLRSKTSQESQRKSPKEEEKSYSCLECGERFAEVLALVEHHKNHTRPQTDQGEFRCSECGKCFSHQTSLDSHLRSHKDEKPLLCSECGQCFMEMSALVVHQKTHEMKKPLRKVGKHQHREVLPRLGSGRTTQTAQESKPHLCSECGQCFVERSALVKHQKAHKLKKTQSKVVKRKMTPTSRPAFCCSQCGAAFGSQYSLDDHLRRHADEDTSYVCPECGLCFMGMSSLQQHQKTHIGKKPRLYYKRKRQIVLQSEEDGDVFSCEECGKCFGNKASLRKHYRTHTGEKPFPCLECGKSFSQSSSLAVHRRRHRGEKNYSCLECGKSFIRKADVDRHLISHTGERNYTCAQCGKCYAQLSALIAHRKVHAGVMPHSCSDCGKSFTERWMLVRHEKTHTKKFTL